MAEGRDARARRLPALVLAGLALPLLVTLTQAAAAVAPEPLSVRATRAALAVGMHDATTATAVATAVPYTPSPAVRALVEKVRQELVPADGVATDYGLAFDGKSYAALLTAYPRLPVDPTWAAAYEQLDVTLACCTVAHPVADETKNCGCGHHHAMYALAKQLLAEGWGPKQVQRELDRWAAYFFPKETIMAELERRSVSDPAVAQAVMELTTKGGC